MERYTAKQIHTGRRTDRWINGQVDRKTIGQNGSIDNQTDKQIDRKILMDRNKDKDGKSRRQTGRQKDGWIDRRSD